MPFLQKLKRFRLRAFDRSDQLQAGKRTVENDDAGTQAMNAFPQAGASVQVPINYVPPADEGRPRH